MVERISTYGAHQSTLDRSVSRKRAECYLCLSLVCFQLTGPSLDGWMDRRFHDTFTVEFSVALVSHTTF